MEALSFDFHSVGTIHSKLSTDITINAKCSFLIFYPRFIFVGKKLQRGEWKKIFFYLLNFHISGSFSATEVPNFSFTCLIFFFFWFRLLFVGGKLQTKLSSNSSVQYMFYSHFFSLSFLFVWFSLFCSIVTFICVLCSFLLCSISILFVRFPYF